MISTASMTFDSKVKDKILKMACNAFIFSKCKWTDCPWAEDDNKGFGLLVSHQKQYSG